MGVDTGFEDPANAPPPPTPDPEVPSYSGGSATGVHCILDNVSIDCADAFNLVRTRIAAIAPAQTLQRVIYQGQPVWAPFRAYADGYSGYQPTTAQYTGNGQFSPFSKPARPALYVRPAGAPRDTNFAALNGATGEAYLKGHTASVTLIEERGYALSADLNLIPGDESDKIIEEIAKTINDKNCYSVVAHGTSSSIWNKSKQHIFPRQLAEIIKSDPKYDPSKPVKLYSCNTGKTPTEGGSSFGELLAKELGNEVIAPDGYVCWGKSKWGSTSIYLSADGSCSALNYVSSYFGPNWRQFIPPNKEPKK